MDSPATFLPFAAFFEVRVLKGVRIAKKGPSHLGVFFPSVHQRGPSKTQNYSFQTDGGRKEQFHYTMHVTFRHMECFSWFFVLVERQKLSSFAIPPWMDHKMHTWYGTKF